MLSGYQYVIVNAVNHVLVNMFRYPVNTKKMFRMSSKCMFTQPDFPIKTTYYLYFCLLLLFLSISSSDSTFYNQFINCQGEKMEQPTTKKHYAKHKNNSLHFSIYFGTSSLYLNIILNILLAVLRSAWNLKILQNQERIPTFYHIHGCWGHTVAGMAYSPHWVLVSTHTVNSLHKGSVEAHHAWIAYKDHNIISGTVSTQEELEGMTHNHVSYT